MSRLMKFVIITSFSLFAALVQAQEESKDAKDIPVQQQPKALEEDEWHFTLTPYFWLPSILATVSTPDIQIGNRTIGGEFSVDQTWWDTLSKFSSDFYVLCLDGRFEAWKGRWGGFFDGYWVFGKSTTGSSDSGLVFRDRVDITATSSVTSRFDTGQFNFGPEFVLAKAPLGADSQLSVVLYGGGRVNWLGQDLDGSLTIRGSANVGEIGETFHFSRSDGRAFIEPMIGLKTMWRLGPHVNLLLRGDVAGFGFVDADNWDCDLEAGLGWEFRRNTYLDFGYRARGQWQDLGASDEIRVRGWYHGPELGLTFSF